MKRAYKTSQKKRTNYIYYTAEGAKIVITPGEDGVTEAYIQLLHEMDDAEVDEQRRYDYRVTAHLDAYHAFAKRKRPMTAISILRMILRILNI